MPRNLEPHVDDLTDEMRRFVLRFLLFRMDLTTRGKLMEQMPVAYAVLFPGTEMATVERVTNVLATLAVPTTPAGAA